MKRLGLYGGSFDPVHLGHLLVAHAAIEELRLDRLFFIPAAHSPFKPDSTPAPPLDRLRMLRTALAGMTRAEVDDQELHRGGVSYSIETARAHAGRFPGAQLFWLIGADHVPSLSRWRDAAELASLVQFVVIPRPGAATSVLAPPFRISELRGFPIALASSEIRGRIRNDSPVAHLLPPGVGEIIRDSRLYR